MSQSGFPLLRMEPMLVKDAMEHTTCFDVLNMSLASPGTRNLISKYARGKLQEIQVCVGRTCYVTVIGRNGGSDKFVWEITSAPPREPTGAYWSNWGSEIWREKVYLADGVWEDLVAVDYPDHSSIDHGLTTRCADVVGTLEKILKFLQLIFRKPTTSVLTIDTDLFNDFERMKQWKLHCGIFKFRFCASKNRVPGHFFKNVLENFQIEDVRCVQRGVELGLKYRRPLNICRMRLIAGWIRLRHLCQMQSEFVYIRAPNITQENLNTFIKKWIAGEIGHNFKTVSLNQLHFKIIPEIAFEGVQRFPKTHTQYREGDLDSEVYWRDGFDIKRTTDGREATILWDDYMRNHIVIIVKL